MDDLNVIETLYRRQSLRRGVIGLPRPLDAVSAGAECLSCLSTVKQRAAWHSIRTPEYRCFDWFRRIIPLGRRINFECGSTLIV